MLVENFNIYKAFTFLRICLHTAYVRMVCLQFFIVNGKTVNEQSVHKQCVNKCMYMYMYVSMHVRMYVFICMLLYVYVC